MAEPILSLGGIPFAVIEQPDTLPLGGEQTVSVIKFPGGGINVQTLGAFEDPIPLKGTFWYGGALSRAQTLDRFRLDGSEVLLKWGGIARYVTVTKFLFTVYTAEQVDYDMTLQPTRTSVIPVATGATPVRKSPSRVAAEAAVNVSSVGTSGVASSPSTTTQAVRYRVKAGDTLWKIAVYYYHDGTQYTRIAQANNLTNPSAITVGQLLVIPQ